MGYIRRTPLNQNTTNGSAPHDSKVARTGFLVTAISIALAAAVYLGGSQRLIVVRGDEPHYLIMTDSIVQDRTLDLRNAYLRQNESRHIYPSRLLNPHVRIARERWAPWHAPGLPLLLALPFLAGGIIGAKLALCALAGLLTLALYSFLARRVPIKQAMALTLGLIVCLPFCFGASQIYPDFVGGILAACLAVWLIHAGEQPRNAAGWAVFWLAAGSFPWLNSKYLAATVILTAWALGVRWQLRRQGVRSSWLEVATVALVLVGVLGLAGFHYWGVGQPFGPRGLREISSPFSRAAMIFLGLHFDQSQGMFIQHPLLITGIAALPIFAWRRRLDAFFWLGLYASLIVPNSMELARWGAGGPVGRFAWSAEWLWAIPLGFAIAEYPTTLIRFVKPAVIASLAYQALLALRWTENPLLLFPRLEESLAARDSLFPISLRPFVPSFYFWDFKSYWTYPPNVIAFASALALLTIGTLPLLDHARTALISPIVDRPSSIDVLRRRRDD